MLVKIRAYRSQVIPLRVECRILLAVQPDVPTHESDLKPLQLLHGIGNLLRTCVVRGAQKRYPCNVSQPQSEGNVLQLAAATDYGATVPLPISERQTANGTEKVVIIDPEYVRQMVASIVKDQDLSRYIL